MQLHSVFSLIEMLARSCSSSPYSSVHFHANVLFLPSLIELLVRSQCKLGHLDYFDFKNKHQKKTFLYSSLQCRTCENTKDCNGGKKSTVWSGNSKLSLSAKNNKLSLSANKSWYIALPYYFKIHCSQNKKSWGKIQPRNYVYMQNIHIYEEVILIKKKLLSI